MAWGCQLQLWPGGDLPSVTHYSCSVYIHNIWWYYISMVHLVQRKAIISESRARIEADLHPGSGRRRLIINELESLHYINGRLIITRRRLVHVCALWDNTALYNCTYKHQEDNTCSFAHYLPLSPYFPPYTHAQLVTFEPYKPTDRLVLLTQFPSHHLSWMTTLLVTLLRD